MQLMSAPNDQTLSDAEKLLISHPQWEKIRQLNTCVRDFFKKIKSSSTENEIEQSAREEFSKISLALLEAQQEESAIEDEELKAKHQQFLSRIGKVLNLRLDALKDSAPSLHQMYLTGIDKDEQGNSLYNLLSQYKPVNPAQPILTSNQGISDTLQVQQKPTIGHSRAKNTLDDSDHTGIFRTAGRPATMRGHRDRGVIDPAIRALFNPDKLSINGNLLKSIRQYVRYHKEFDDAAELLRFCNEFWDNSNPHRAIVSASHIEQDNLNKLHKAYVAAQGENKNIQGKEYSNYHDDILVLCRKLIKIRMKSLRQLKPRDPILLAYDGIIDKQGNQLEPESALKDLFNRIHTNPFGSSNTEYDFDQQSTSTAETSDTDLFPVITQSTHSPGNPFKFVVKVGATSGTQNSSSDFGNSNISYEVTPGSAIGLAETGLSLPAATTTTFTDLNTVSLTSTSSPNQPVFSPEVTKIILETLAPHQSEFMTFCVSDQQEPLLPNIIVLLTNVAAELKKPRNIDVFTNATNERQLNISQSEQKDQLTFAYEFYIQALLEISESLVKKADINNNSASLSKEDLILIETLNKLFPPKAVLTAFKAMDTDRANNGELSRRLSNVKENKAEAELANEDEKGRLSVKLQKCIVRLNKIATTHATTQSTLSTSQSSNSVEKAAISKGQRRTTVMSTMGARFLPGNKASSSGASASSDATSSPQSKEQKRQTSHGGRR